ncbi:PPC domain-containing protein [Anabaenopsis tanganyikae CS-531]|uniref:PPC domain-containing protein n=2 Tax=Anabaenopsis TaxID=110103 RepID=A0ABT5AQE2_9CYAN|nr:MULTISPECIES: PPC domain-containing protein [Anabaenopsis]MDB9538933.1 PPC domain-containing protein [Anabaenopsis arnoldii]MDH6091221.1 PPC domain-containing protein [Anabaenopsis arnoldii]MDH6105652.1 PPC domain-containing protein [Anabaenopsis tanganyikae CS-531]
MISKAFLVGLRELMMIPTTLLVIGINTTVGYAQNELYNPIPITPSTELSDTLSEKDIPTGQGGFGRDYIVNLNKGDKLVIDLNSESFDTVITLLGPNGATVAENDDGPDGTTNSLLFTRIQETGKYIIRVRSFGETGVGLFELKVTKLQAVK